MFAFHHTRRAEIRHQQIIHTDAAMGNGFPSVFIHCDYIFPRSGDFFVRAARKYEKAQFFGCTGKAGYV